MEARCQKIWNRIAHQQKMQPYKDLIQKLIEAIPAAYRLLEFPKRHCFPLFVFHIIGIFFIRAHFYFTIWKRLMPFLPRFFTQYLPWRHKQKSSVIETQKQRLSSNSVSPENYIIFTFKNYYQWKIIFFKSRSTGACF
jgi:hypothetical protein